MAKKRTILASNSKELDENPLISVMKKYKVPMTEEEFQKLRYMGEVPEEIGAEDAADIPAEVRPRKKKGS